MRLVCDWHGTFVFDDRTERLFKRIGLFSLICLLFKSPRKAYSVYKTARVLNLTQVTWGNLASSVQTYNDLFRGIVSCKTRDRIVMTSSWWDSRNLTLNQPVARVLSSVKHLFKQRLLLSSGVRPYIKGLLKCFGCSSIFDNVVANEFDEESGNFVLTVMQNKGEIIRDLFGANLDDVVYIGNDLYDKAAFSMVGFPVVSNLSSPHLKSEFIGHDTAHIVENEQEFVEYLYRIYDLNKKKQR